MRKVAVVTGTRAEYGLLYGTIKGIHENPDMELQLIVTGTHLSEKFGMTINRIKEDGFPIAAQVDLELASDSQAAVAESMGKGMIGFSAAYEKLRPDIVVVLGDRSEIFAAVAAAIPFGIIVAHIHGGELTEGAIDEQFRHAITKMSHIHFPVAQEYAQRIISMGEDPDCVYNFGSPAVDNIKNMKLMNREKLAAELELPTGSDWGMVTYHPVTAIKGKTDKESAALLDALSEFDKIFWVITMPNADTENEMIISRVTDFAEKRSNARLFASLGQLRYLSLMKHALLMAGNSSSGIIESASFQLPVVNIGSRQKGRIRSRNVIDVLDATKGQIVDSITEALSDGFRESLNGLENRFGDGNAAGRIIDVLKNVELTNLFNKKFYQAEVF